MTSFPLSAYTQSFECFHDNPASSLDSMEIFCVECSFEREGSYSEIIYRMIDDLDDYIINRTTDRKINAGGSITERKPLSLIRDLPSGHDWIASETRYPDGSIRAEFAPVTVDMADRIFNIEESITLGKYEHICPACHYVCHKEVACPNCN